MSQDVQDERKATTVEALSLDGVDVYIDPEREEAWVLVLEGHCREDLAEASEFISHHGYEVMPELECPPEVYGDGSVRHWLAEKEDE